MKKILIMLSLLLVPGVIFATSYNSFSLKFKNGTKKRITIQEHKAIIGSWSRRKKPKLGATIRPGRSVGPFGTESQTINQGSSGQLFFKIGDEKIEVQWVMPWRRSVKFRIQSKSYKLFKASIIQKGDVNHLEWVAIIIAKDH